MIVLKNVVLRRGAKVLLDGASATLNPGEKVGLVGRNGAGKSTLFALLNGSLHEERGEFHMPPSWRLAQVAQHMPETDQPATLFVLEGDTRLLEAQQALAQAEAANDGEAIGHAHAMLADAGAHDARARAQTLILGLGFQLAQLDQPVNSFSGGWRMRLQLARALMCPSDLMLLDEPTNHLDRSGLDFLTTQLRARNGGVVIVSHDRALLSDIAETVVDLDPTPDDRPRIYGNGYAGYREGRLAERERWEQEYERQQQEQSRLQESLSAAQNRLVSGWRPEKGSPKHGRATRAGGLVQSVHRRQEALEAHAVTVPEPPQLFQFPDLPTRKGAVLLNVDNVSFAGRLAQPVSFELSHRGRLVITGSNGAGKSTLLSIAAGELLPDTGTVRTSRGTRLGFLRQETMLPPDRRANEIYARHLDELVGQGTLQSSETVGLGQLGLLRSREAGKRVGELSMGQQRRLDLALVLAARPHVLLLDEPTNHLSIALVDELTEALGATQAAVVLSTHDRQLLRDVAQWPHDHLMAMAEGEALV